MYLFAEIWSKLSILDQNENVNRPNTSQHTVTDLRRPDRRAAMKVLVAKSYNFVDILWDAYISKNSTDMRYIPILIFNVYAC